MKRLFLGLALLSMFALTAVYAHADDHIVGVVNRVGPTMVEVTTDSGETMQVALDPDTQYLKWITEKPWAQDPKVDASWLRVGERVHIHLRKDDPASARKVWIVVGRVDI